MTVIGELVCNAVVDTSGAQKAASEYRTVVRSLATVSTGSAAAVAAIGLSAAFAGSRLVRSQAEIADSIDRMGQKLNLSVEDLSRYRYAAKLTADMADGALDEALERMNTNAGMAAQGLGKSRKAFDELGLSAKYLVSLETDQRLAKIADAISRVDKSADRVRIAEKIFGTGDMALVLRQGAAGLRQLGDESDRVGATLDGLANEKLAAADNALDRMSKSVAGAKHALGGVLAPVVTGVADSVTDFIASFQKLPPKFNEAEHQAKLHNETLERQRNIVARVNEEFERRASIVGKAHGKLISDALHKEFQEDQAELASLRNEILQARRGNATFGMNDVDRAKWEQQHTSVDKSLHGELIKELEIRQRLEETQQAAAAAAERENQARDRAAAIIQQNLTPLEELTQRLAEIEELQAAGKLSADQAIRAAQNARQGYAGSVSTGSSSSRSPLAAVGFGSSEAMRAIAESRNQDRSKIPEAQLKELKEGNDLTQKLLDKLDDLKLADVATW